MKKKNVYLIFIIVFFLTSSMTPMHNFSIVADSEPSGDSVVWENNYGRLEVYPHTSNELAQHTQYANVTWKLSNNNIDLAFRFDNPLDVSKCNIWMWQNISHDVVIYDYGNISANYTLENISSFTPHQGTPSYVDLGDIPSNYYYNGTYSMNNITFNVTIGFNYERYTQYSWYAKIWENESNALWFKGEAYDWDINRDKTVNYLDASSLTSHYGESGAPGWIQDDIIEDGVINYLDASSLTSHYGESY